MNKQLVLTFILGAVFGGGFSSFFFLMNPEDVKVLTKTEYKEVPVHPHSIQNDSREVTKFPEHSSEDSPHDADEVGRFDSPSDESTEGLSQMENFERTMASDQEVPQAIPEDESPSDGPGENSAEEPSEN